MVKMTLPKSGPSVATALKEYRDAALRLRNLHVPEWVVAHYYLQGAREFQGINYAAGTVEVMYQDQTGHMNFKFEPLLRNVNLELGQLMRVDVKPAAKPRVLGLDAVRDASISKVALDEATGAWFWDSIKDTLFSYLAKYGMCGIGMTVRAEQQTNGTVRRVYEPEIIPPWELLATPSGVEDLDKLQALQRDRWVPLAWLTDVMGLKVPQRGSKDWSKMGIVTVSPGASKGGSSENFPGTEITGGISTTIGASQGETYEKDTSKNAEREDVQMVRLLETWSLGPRREVSRYCRMLGDYLHQDQTYPRPDDEGRPLIPFWIAQRSPGCGFYSRGIVAQTLSLGMAVERVLENLFTEIENADMFGFMCIPQGMGIQEDDLRATNKPRVLFYEPDYTAPFHEKPFNIAPTFFGDTFGKFVEALLALIDRQFAQAEMLTGGAPGRVDSAQAIGMLTETATTPLIKVAASVADAFTTIYRAIQADMRYNFDRNQTLHLTTLDDSVAGIKLNSDGSIGLDDNPIPHPDKVRLDIVNRLPKFGQGRKAELAEMLTAGLCTPMQFRMTAYREDLDFPIVNQAEYQNFRSAILENILLFGDGQQSSWDESKAGGFVSSVAHMPEVHLSVLQQFMGRPEFKLASPEVRDAFAKRKQFYEQQLGVLPPQMPRPEQAAQMADELQKALAQGPPGGGEQGLPTGGQLPGLG